jgi:guanylate kinase
MPYNDEEVYRKQEKKFNIITLRPKEHDQILKQYPKLTLENKDEFFYKRMEQQRKEMEASIYRDHVKNNAPPDRMVQSNLM